MSQSLVISRPAHGMAVTQFGGENLPSKTTSSSPSIGQRVSNAFYSIIDTLAPISPVGGYRQLFTLIPESAELALGKYFHKLEYIRRGESYNKAVVDITERASARLAPVTDRKLPYQVKVIDSAVLNACCFPGGYMIMNRGLVEGMLNCKDDFGLGPISDEEKVAAIMAHEMTHAAARHGMRGIEFSIFVAGFLFVVAKVAQYALGAFAHKESDPAKKGLAEAAATLIETIYEHLGDIVATLWRASFSRDNEDEADKHGMVYLKRAGYDPRAMIWAMKFLAKTEVDHIIPWLHHVTDWFRSHDHADNRAKKCEKTAEELAAGKIPVSPTSAFNTALLGG